jgi:hypothetical protein
MMQRHNAAVFQLSRRKVLLGSLALFGTPTVSLAGTITDAGKISISVTAPKRIVTIGSAVTEIVFALGERSKVVAIDLTSIYVDGAEGLTNVGYMRALSTEGVLAQAPDLMCVSSDSGPPEVLDALRASGIPFALIPHVPTIEGIKHTEREFLPQPHVNSLCSGRDRKCSGRFYLWHGFSEGSVSNSEVFININTPVQSKYTAADSNQF